MFLSTNTCEGKRDCINQCPQYSKIVTEAMWWTWPNVMAVECACTIVLQTILLLKMGLYMEYVPVAEYVKKFVRTVLMVMSLKKTNSLL